MLRSLNRLSVLLLTLFVVGIVLPQVAHSAATAQEYGIFSLERVSLGLGANYERTFGDQLELPDVVTREWNAGPYLVYNLLPGDEETGKGSFDITMNVLRGFDSHTNRFSFGLRWTAFTGRHGS